MAGATPLGRGVFLLSNKFFIEFKVLIKMHFLHSHFKSNNKKENISIYLVNCFFYWSKFEYVNINCNT